MKKIMGAILALVIFTGCGDSDEQLRKRADKIHRDIVSVDTHCDTPMSLVNSDFDPGVRNDKGCVDFPRMKEGGLDAEFFAVFIGQGPRNDSTYEKVHQEALKVFDAIHRNVEKYSSAAGLAFSPSDAVRLKEDGRVAVYIGLENGYPIGLDISRVKQYYDLGARYITLCHSGNNDICDSSSDPKGPEHNGLSAFGAEVVLEMNRLGMMVDVSHISDKSFYDAINLSRAPVIASHSSCRALCSSPRNFTDDMLLALKANGGVIQICILTNYIKTPEPNPELDARMKELNAKYGNIKDISEDQRKAYYTERWELRKQLRKLAAVSDVVDHIDHVVQVIGIDHVGIGTDFDGGGAVNGCRSVADMKNITIELLRRGYSKDDIEKIWSGNVMRVFRKAEEVARQI
jgi:membrane dipeptidase